MAKKATMTMMMIVMEMWGNGSRACKHERIIVVHHAGLCRTQMQQKGRQKSCGGKSVL